MSEKMDNNQNSNNDWDHYQIFVLHELQRMNTAINEQVKALNKFNERLLKLEVKASLWGGLAGAAIVGAAEVLKFVLLKIQ